MSRPLPDVDAMVTACVEMLGRLGVRQMRVGYTPEEDGEPVVWYATGSFTTAGGVWEAAAGMRPDQALYRLIELAMDGGKCLHCERPSGVVADAQAADMPMNELVCWYAYDPELKRFRRSCEGASNAP